MISILGNSAPGVESVRTGSGALARRAPFGHITVSGKAGDVARISVVDLYPKFDQTFKGISAQALGGSVKIAVTLAPIDLALNPDQDIGGHWVQEITVAPGQIITLEDMSTTLRITFVANAILYLLGV